MSANDVMIVMLRIAGSRCVCHHRMRKRRPDVVLHAFQQLVAETSPAKV
jgi:hypothetical protein